VPLTSIVDFVANQVLTAAQIDDVNCGVKSFATTATRDAAYGGSGERTLAEGETCYIEGDDVMQVYSGSVWENAVRTGAWVTFTPGLQSYGTGTDWALGNGSTTGAYMRVGRALIGFLQLTIGSTTTKGTKNLAFGTPVKGKATLPNDENAVGTCGARDVSGADGFSGVVRIDNNGDILFPQFLAASGTYATNVTVTSTVPMTWATGDFLTMTFVYELNA